MDGNSTAQEAYVPSGLFRVASKTQDIFFPYGAHKARCHMGVTKAWVRNCCQGWKNPIYLLSHGLTKFCFYSLWALED